MSKLQKNPNVLISKSMLNVNISKGQMPNVKISKMPKQNFNIVIKISKLANFNVIISQSMPNVIISKGQMPNFTISKSRSKRKI